ncbi:MAG: hypothetical protein AAF697_09220 [Pseudomonadota bacterium]
MFGTAAAAIFLVANLSGGTGPCLAEDTYEPAWTEVCAEWLDGAPAYSASVRDLSPYMVMLAHYEGKWVMQTIFNASERGVPVDDIRRNRIEVSDEDAQSIVALMDEPTLEKLAAQPYFGPGDHICVGGSRYELAMARDGQRYAAATHSCAGRGELHVISDAFRELAMKYDPEFGKVRGGFTVSPDAS